MSLHLHSVCANWECILCEVCMFDCNSDEEKTHDDCCFWQGVPRPCPPPLSLQSSHLHVVLVAPLQIIKMCQ